MVTYDLLHNKISMLVLLLPMYIIHSANTNNACHSCITAAAGTCIGHDFSLSFNII